MGKIFGLGGVIATAIVVLMILFGSSYTIDQGEVGVTLRNGAVTGQVGPGRHYKLPIIDDYVVLHTRQRRVDFGGEGHLLQAYSKDLQLANLQLTINVSVNEAHAADLYANYGVDYVNNILTPIVYSTVKVVFGQYDAATAISKRAQLVSAMTDAVRAGLQIQDIRIDTLSLTDVSFSKQFNDAVEDRMQQEIKVQQKLQELAQERVNADIARTQAQGAADSQVERAKAQAEATVLAGNAEAQAIRARGDALKDNPGLVALTAAERWNGSLPSTMVPGGAVPFLNLGNNLGVPSAEK